MKEFRTRKRFIVPVALLMVGAIATAAAATILFTHTFPSVILPGRPALVTANCSPGVVAGTIPSTSPGFIIFSCPSPAAGAFTTTPAGTVAIGVVTGGLPGGFTGLYAIPAGIAVSGSCSASISAIMLLGSNTTPGTSLTITVSSGSGLSSNTPYNYCADFFNPNTSSLTLPTFTVSWQE